MRVYEKSVIKVNASTENGKVVLDIEGPLSAVASPVIKRINKIFQEEKPIRADEENIIFSTWSPPIPSTAFNRLISAQIGAVMKKRIPDQFSIGITDKCPYNCIHCGAAGIVADPELSIEEINRAVGEAIELGTYSVQFDGGETMLRSDIADMVASVDKTRAIATCFTSGFRLTPERAQDLKNAGLFATHISIDSPFESEHDRVRGREGAYQNAMDGIQNSLDAGILTDMFVVVSPDNIDDLEDFYGLAESLGMHEMSIYEIIAVGRWLEREDETISQKDVSRLEKFQKEKNMASDGPRVTAFPYFMGPDQFGCFAGRRWIHVTSGGDVMPCAYTPLAFGNIREDALADIWKRMGKHSAYKGSAEYCMMRNPEFRKEYIHTIPKDATIPLRIDLQEKN
ncbi:radical SAM protein [Methanococcoides orientis]|uniref:radical SAM protein n=1 Tax=Methanococcoides orientis TaxID=2822137 RepID=UPI001E28A0C7|nr:radical SAM protein [Methanococcoides orientis]UGV39945.1 radical SAM protein [Methanococcoides orientis]